MARRAGWRGGPGRGRPGGETVAVRGGRWRTAGPGRGWPGGDTAVGREEGLRRAGKRDKAGLACMDLRSRGGLGAGRTCCGIELAVAAAPAPSAEGGSFWRGKEREIVSLCQDVRPAASGAGGKGPTFGCAGGVGGPQAGGEGMAVRAAGGASGARAARAAGRGGGWRRKQRDSRAGREVRPAGGGRHERRAPAPALDACDEANHHPSLCILTLSGLKVPRDAMHTTWTLPICHC